MNQEVMNQKRTVCFEHPYISMINTLKNNDYVPMSNGSWIHQPTGELFDTALDAYLHYLEGADESEEV